MKRDLFMIRDVGLALAGFGVVCLTWFAVQFATTASFQREQNVKLAQEIDAGAGPRSVTGPAPRPAPAPANGIVGRLEIPRLGMSAIVVEGEDAATLKRAVGHLPDTAMPWEDGNTALAGHRDTFFRPLRAIHLGDEVRLVTAHGTFVYRVQETQIVGPDDVGVLSAGPRARLTLVTCYPFSYVGSAPWRFIVRAERLDDLDR